MTRTSSKKTPTRRKTSKKNPSQIEPKSLLAIAIRSKVNSEASLWDYYCVNAPPVPSWYWSDKSDLVDNAGRFPDIEDFMCEINPDLVTEIKKWQTNYDKQTKWFTWNKDTPEYIISTYNQLFKEYNHYKLLVSIDNSQFERERFFMWITTYAVEMLMKRSQLASNTGNPLSVVSGNTARLFLDDLKKDFRAK